MPNTGFEIHDSSNILYGYIIPDSGCLPLDRAYKSTTYDLLAEGMHLEGYDLATMTARDYPATCSLHCTVNVWCKGYNLVLASGVYFCELKQGFLKVSLSDLSTKDQSSFYTKTINCI